MSYVFASPEWVAAAANDLASIGSTINAASSAAAAPTASVLAAGADDVSTVIAALFGAHAQAYQALSAQAAMFHEQFVQLMTAGGAQYAAAEAVNATPMQEAAAAISAPFQALTGGVSASSSPGASTAGISDERVLLHREGGALVQIGTGGHGPAVGSGAMGAASSYGVSGAGNAAAPLLGSRFPVTVSDSGGRLLPGVATLPAAAMTAGPDESAGGVGGLLFGQGAVPGLGSGPALAAASPAGTSAGAPTATSSTAGTANEGQHDNVGGHGGWLYGDGGLSAQTRLFGDGAAGGNGALVDAGQLRPAGEGSPNSGSFFSGSGAGGVFGNPAAGA